MERVFFFMFYVSFDSYAELDNILILSTDSKKSIVTLFETFLATEGTTEIHCQFFKGRHNHMLHFFLNGVIT